MVKKLKPTLRTFTEEENHQTRLQVRTIIPARVLSYSTATQRAEIELSTQTVLELPDGTTDQRPALIIPNVPVSWPASGTGYMHFDLKKGDTGLALVCDRSNARWRQDGEAHAPAFPSLHNLADCMFLPGVRADNNPLSPPPASGTTVEGESVNLGALANRGVARLNDSVAADAVLTTHIEAIETLLGVMLAALATPFPPIGGAQAAFQAATATPITKAGVIDSASSKVKSE